MYQPILLYTTEEHGCSLTTFYVRVEHHEPTLLLIKTCNNEVKTNINGLFDNVYLIHVFLRYLVRIVLQSGWREIKKMTAVTDKLILELVRRSYSVYILVRRNINGSAWKLTIYIMPMNYLWQLIKK